MKLSKFTVVILALTLFTLITWLVYQVRRLDQKDVVFENIEAKYTQELRPDFNPQILERLEARN